MSATDKRLRASKRGQGRGVVGNKDQVTAFVDQPAFFVRRSTPQHEGRGSGASRCLCDHSIGQQFPTLSLVAIGLTLFHRQAGIEQQSSLLRPSNKAAAGHGHGGPGLAQIALTFFEDIAQRRRQRLARSDRKSEALSLAAPVVGVLPQDDGVHCVQRRQLQRPQRLRRKDHRALVDTAFQKSQQALAFDSPEERIHRRLPVGGYRPIFGVGGLQTRRGKILGE